MALDAESQELLAVEATHFENYESGQNYQETTSESRMLDFIYDDEPLGFEKYPLTSTKKM